MIWFWCVWLSAILLRFVTIVWSCEVSTEQSATGGGLRSWLTWLIVRRRKRSASGASTTAKRSSTSSTPKRLVRWMALIFLPRQFYLCWTDCVNTSQGTELANEPPHTPWASCKLIIMWLDFYLWFFSKPLKGWQPLVEFQPNLILI